MKRIKKYFAIIKPLIYMIILFFASALGLALINFIINIFIGLISGNFDFKRDIFDIPHLSSAIEKAIITIVLFIWYKKLNKNEGQVIKKRITIKDAGFIIVWGVGMVLFIKALLNCLFSILERYFPRLTSEYESLMSYTHEGSVILLALSISIITPVLEELVFRGIILKKAIDLIPFCAANIVQAVLFGLIHLNIIQGMYAFFIGILFGYITKRYSSIFPTIILHFLFNAAAVLVVAYEKMTGKVFDPSIGLNVVIAVLGGIVFIAGFIKMKRNTAIEEKPELLRSS